MTPNGFGAKEGQNKEVKTMKTVTLPQKFSRNWHRSVFLLISLFLQCVTLVPRGHAVSPPPDGGYPNGNTAEGDSALFSLTSGVDNTAVGAGALFSNTFGSNNTATGFQSLNSNTNGSDNTAYGFRALISNQSGSTNTATGSYALYTNMTANNNTADGFQALLSNTTGTQNTATGSNALKSNTTAGNNTADGVNALFSNTTGGGNTATGSFALNSNTAASNNTADGFLALFGNTTGTQNTATGAFALYNNNTSNNTAHGFKALFHNITGSANTAVGYHALFNNTGASNIAVGSNAGVNLTTGINNIDIGNVGAAGESYTIRIGGTQIRTFIKGISGVAVAGAAVVVNAAGQLGVAASSERFKDEIKPMGKASEAILALKPVTFRYRKALDPERIPQFGLVAEEVAKVNPDLVVRDDKGEIYTVRYDAVNAMLLNEFLKEHRTVQEQKATITQLKKDFAEQRIQIKALTTGLQKVSDQLETRRETTKVVINNP
jgi:hypothetical protein